MRGVAVVGAGLVGTSLSLALARSGVPVWLTDRDPERLEAALRISGAAPWPAPEPDPATQSDSGPHLTPPPADLAVACVSPAATGAVLAWLTRLDPDWTVSDVASVKAKPLSEAETAGADMTRVVGGHPLAGREVSGPEGAQRDLFEGRAWALCPSPTAPSWRVEAVERLVAGLGARPVRLRPADHDEAVAVLSHVPQLVSSALAEAGGRLPESWRLLAGPGFADMTRLAASPPEMWAEIAAANATALAGATEAVAVRLHALAGTLVQESGPASQAVGALVRAGGQARLGFGDKARAPGHRLEWVAVVVPDQPGVLVAVLTAAASVNVEDLRIDHTPHQPTGVLDLAVAPGQGPQLVALLEAAGWQAHVRISGLVDSSS